MSIEAVLCDHGNVLGRNSGPAAREIARKFGHVYGLELSLASVKSAMKEALEGFTEGKIEETVFWQNFSRLVKPTIVNPIDRLLWVELGIEYDHLSEFDEEAMHIIDSLKKLRKRTGIASNIIKPLAAINRAKGRYDQFNQDLIFLSCELGMSKKDPDFFRVTCERGRLNPKTTLFIDNVPDYVEIARSVGLQGIEFDAGSQDYSVLRSELGKYGLVIDRPERIGDVKV